MDKMYVKLFSEKISIDIFYSKMKYYSCMEPNFYFVLLTFTDGVGNAQVAPSTRRPFSRSSSKGNTGGGISRDTSRPPSAFENQMDYFREPVVKSPPEPTRVKSPTEGMVRSPDPINWTVPLDTGKTFSVTQSVRDGGNNFAKFYEPDSTKNC